MQQGWSAADWLQYLLSFAFVIALLLGLLWTLRKLQGGQIVQGGLLRRKSSRLQLIESLSIGPRQKLALVNVDGREVLLGITAQTINALQPWNESHAVSGERPKDAAPAPAAEPALTQAAAPTPAQDKALNVDDENIRTWLLGRHRGQEQRS